MSAVHSTEEPTMSDEIAIQRVRGLRHRVGTQHSCKCEECRAIKRVCGLALEATAQAASRSRSKNPSVNKPAVGEPPA